MLKKIIQKLKGGSKAKPEAKPKKGKPDWFEPEGKLAIDVYKAPGEIVIEAPLAGVPPEDVHISIKGDTVTVKGIRERPSNEIQQKDYYSQECYWGKFSRKIIMPEETDPGRAQATINKGILRITVPTIDRQKEREVEIKG